MEVYGCLWTFVLWVCISIGRVIEIVSVIMGSILIMIILRRTHRKPLFIEVGWDIMLV